MVIIVIKEGATWNILLHCNADSSLTDRAVCVGTSLSIVQPGPSRHHEAVDSGHRTLPCLVHLQAFDGDLAKNEKEKGEEEDVTSRHDSSNTNRPEYAQEANQTPQVCFSYPSPCIGDAPTSQTTIQHSTHV